MQESLFPTPERITKLETIKHSVVQQGVEKGVAWAVLRLSTFRQLNGYLLLPENHPWVCGPFDEIVTTVHGGVSYRTKEGLVMFDTLHFDLGDWADWVDQRKYRGIKTHEWTVDEVVAETKSFAREAAAVEGWT